MQPIHTINTYSQYIQPIHTTNTYNQYMQPIHTANTYRVLNSWLANQTLYDDPFFLENKFRHELHKLPGKNDYFWLKNSALHVISLLPSIHYWSALSNDLGLNSKFEEVGTPYRLSINAGPLYSSDGVRLYLYGTTGSNGPIVHLSDVTWMNMEHWGSNNWQGKIEVVCSERILPLLPVCAFMAGNRENFAFFIPLPLPSQNELCPNSDSPTAVLPWTESWSGPGIRGKTPSRRSLHV